MGVYGDISGNTWEADYSCSSDDTCLNRVDLRWGKGGEGREIKFRQAVFRNNKFYDWLYSGQYASCIRRRSEIRIWERINSMSSKVC